MQRFSKIKKECKIKAYLISSQPNSLKFRYKIVRDSEKSPFDEFNVHTKRENESVSNSSALSPGPNTQDSGSGSVKRARSSSVTSSNVPKKKKEESTLIWDDKALPSSSSGYSSSSSSSDSSNKKFKNYSAWLSSLSSIETTPTPSPCNLKANLTFQEFKLKAKAARDKRLEEQKQAAALKANDLKARADFRKGQQEIRRSQALEGGININYQRDFMAEFEKNNQIKYAFF